MKILKYLLVFTLFSCANIVMPTGGEKDTQAPKVISSLLTKGDNSYIIQFDFDEQIQIHSWDENFYISPPIGNKLQKKVKARSLIITIEDTLCNESTYSICLNSCIKDNNEGNVLTKYFYNFSLNESLDTFSLSGSLKDAYTLDSIEGAAVLLYDRDIVDSLIFQISPNYIAKTDNNGQFNFSNLDTKAYNVFAHQDFNYSYSSDNKTAFLNNTINAKNDSVVSLYAFEPILQDNIILDTILNMKKDSTNNIFNDSSQLPPQNYGRLELVIDKTNACIIQLIKDDQVIKERNFLTGPFVIESIPAATYKIKYIYDLNNDGKWNTGSRAARIQPEKVVYYPNEINIRENWDLVLDWFISE